MRRVLASRQLAGYATPSAPHGRLVLAGARSISWKFWERAAAVETTDGDTAAASQQLAELATFAPAPTTRPTMASTIDGQERTPSVIERLDDGWSGMWESFGVPHFGFVDGGVAWLELATSMGGFSWPAAIFLCGAALRCAALPFALYGERAAMRMARATEESRDAFDRFGALYKDVTVSRVEFQQATEAFRAERDAVFKKHETSNRATMTGLVASPLYMYGLAVVLRAMQDNAGAVGAASALPWAPTVGLSAADPSGIVPCTALLLTVANFELTFARKKGTRGQGLSAYLPWIIRGGALSIVPVILELQSGTAVYWLGLATAGLIQPVLMSCAWFRRAYRVPDGAAKFVPVTNLQDVRDLYDQKQGASDTRIREEAANDPLQARIAQSWPRLTKLLSPGGAVELMDEWQASRDAARMRNQPKVRTWRQKERPDALTGETDDGPKRR